MGVDDFAFRIVFRDFGIEFLDLGAWPERNPVFGIIDRVQDGSEDFGINAAGLGILGPVPKDEVVGKFWHGLEFKGISKKDQKDSVHEGPRIRTTSKKSSYES